MSRSNYSDDIDDQWASIRWRGAVASATNGARGQALLREMLVALDAMPVKELVAGELEADGQYCALGVVGKARGLILTGIDPEDSDWVADLFGIAPALAREIVYVNDEAVYVAYGKPDLSALRWQRVRNWVVSQLKPSSLPADSKSVR